MHIKWKKHSEADATQLNNCPLSAKYTNKLKAYTYRESEFRAYLPDVYLHVQLKRLKLAEPIRNANPKLKTLANKSINRADWQQIRGRRLSDRMP